MATITIGGSESTTGPWLEYTEETAEAAALYAEEQEYTVDWSSQITVRPGTYRAPITTRAIRTYGRVEV